MSKDWILAAEGLTLFSKKYQDAKVARSILGFCLSKGIIRSRGKAVKPPKAAVAKDKAAVAKGDVSSPFLDNDILRPEAWESADIGSRKAWQKAEFTFTYGRWSEFKCQVDEVKFSKSDIIAVHGRKGVGGRTFTADAWFHITHSLVRLAKTGGDKDCASAKDLTDYVFADINGALTREYIEPFISEIWKSHYT